MLSAEVIRFDVFISSYYYIIIPSFHRRNICGITTIKLKSFSKQNQAQMGFSGAQCMKHQAYYYFFLSFITDFSSNKW